MSKKDKAKRSKGRDWTAVRQSKIRKPSTRVAWWRRIRIRFQTIALCLAGISGISFLVLAVSYFTSNPLDVNLAGPSGKLGKLEFHTNGSLDHDWLQEALSLSKDADLMEIDLLDLKEGLHKFGQVANAEVQRRYPDVLRVKVTEHLPILKIYISDPENGKKCLLVSDQGVVFEGIGHPSAIINELPILFGGRLLKSPDGFLPLEVVAKIKPLMDVARMHYPDIIRDWNRIRFDVSKGGEELEGLIRVRSKEAKEIIFSTEMDYLAQLVRLEYVLSYSDRSEWAPLALIDLPGRKSATVRFQNELATSSGGVSKPNQTLLF